MLLRSSCVVMIWLCWAATTRAQCLIYQVTIAGEASGNAFQLQGALKVLNGTVTEVTENGVNPIELSLEVGNPLTAPVVGAIAFSTNTAMRGQRSAVDMAKVTQKKGIWVVEPDAGISATTVNYFNSSSGVLGSIYTIYKGILAVKFSNRNKNVVGEIRFTGRGAYYYMNVPYAAEFAGELVREFPAKRCARPTV